MTLSAAYNIVNSSFAANAAQTAVVSKNIANANTAGYSREIANVLTNLYGGADVDSITREANGALRDQVSNATSQAAGQQAIADGLAKLAQTVNDSASASSASGATQNGASPSAMLAKLQNALQTYAASPGNASVGQAAVNAASGLAASLNSASATVQQVRSQADASMGSSVATINSLLNQFAQADKAVVSGLQSGADASSAMDARDKILGQLSQQLGVSTVANQNGSTSIYTDSGVTLYQDAPRTVTFAPTQTLTPGASGGAVVVDGVPITGAGAPMAIHSGALAGLASLRDSIAPKYQAQLDQIAGALVGAFAETDQSATPTQPPLPGLFTFSGATVVPAANAVMGLAAKIQVNANVDPSQGGNVALLRDGGISSPGNPAYTYNTSGATAFSGRIQQLIDQTSASRSFDPAAGLGVSTSLAGYASDSVGWVQGQNQHASDSVAYQDAVATQANAALSNATGVNLDAEMTHMLNLENSYTATAKLLSTVGAMFTALLQAA